MPGVKKGATDVLEALSKAVEKSNPEGINQYSKGGKSPGMEPKEGLPENDNHKLQGEHVAPHLLNALEKVAPGEYAYHPGGKYDAPGAPPNALVHKPSGNVVSFKHGDSGNNPKLSAFVFGDKAGAPKGAGFSVTRFPIGSKGEINAQGIHGAMQKLAPKSA